MKGKKFTAAEKHFEKKRIQLDKRIKYLEEQLDLTRRELRDTIAKYDFCKRENEELKDWVERLLQYTELSKEDIKEACEKDKRLGEALSWLSRFGGLSLDSSVGTLFNNRKNPDISDDF